MIINGLFCLAGSNHFGTAGWYSLRATEQGLIVSEQFVHKKVSI